MRDIYVVGGGHSLLKADTFKLADVDTIVVNKTLFYIPSADYFITMDYSFMRKMRGYLKAFDKNKATKFFVANFDNNYIKEIDGKIVNTKNNQAWNLQNFDVIVKSKKMSGIGKEWRDFRSGYNSGFCGLQLALLLGYDNIYLMGIDLNIDRITHFHGGYRQNVKVFQERLEEYYEYFKTGIEECKILYPNVNIYCSSKKSRLLDFLEYREFKQ